jgi:hypothetical protein
MSTTSGARLGIDGEQDAGPGLIGTHHLLHADRERHLHVVEPFRFAIRDGAVGEEGGEAPAAGIEQRVLADDVEERLLLAGEARRRQILRGS